MAEQDTTPSTTDEGQVDDKGGSSSSEVPYKGKYEKFKTVKDLEESYGELEKKMGNWKEKEDRLSELEAFEKQATPIVNFLWQDEDTLKKFRDHVTGNTVTKETATKGTEGKDYNLTAEANQVRELVASQESKIVADFEAKYGIDKLEPERQKEVRQTIGKQMAEWLSGRAKPSLSELPNYLEKSYVLINAEKVRESGKVEGFVEALKSQSGAIGNMSSSTSVSDSVGLTSEQKKVAHRMGISEEDYAKNLKKIHQPRSE